MKLPFAKPVSCVTMHLPTGSEAKKQRYRSVSAYNISLVKVSILALPGLRALQSRKELEVIVRRVKSARDSMTWGKAGPPPLLIKIAPDLTEADKAGGWSMVGCKDGWMDAMVLSLRRAPYPPPGLALNPNR